MERTVISRNPGNKRNHARALQVLYFAWVLSIKIIVGGRDADSIYIVIRNLVNLFVK